MKKFRLIKRNQIIVLYHYFLLESNDKRFTDFLKLNVATRINIEDSGSNCQQTTSWFTDFKRKQHEIFALISNHLKSGWKIERIPALEKSIIASTIYTMQSQEIFEKKQLSLLINQTINFSKKYLEKEKCGYINKLLNFAGQIKMKEKQARIEQETTIRNLSA